MNEILSQVFSAGTFTQMLRSATPVALAAMGGSMTEHAGIMNIGMDGMILMGAFFGVLGSWLFASAAAGVVLAWPSPCSSAYSWASSSRCSSSSSKATSS